MPLRGMEGVGDGQEVPAQRMVEEIERVTMGKRGESMVSVDVQERLAWA